MGITLGLIEDKVAFSDLLTVALLVDRLSGPSKGLEARVKASEVCLDSLPIAGTVLG